MPCLLLGVSKDSVFVDRSAQRRAVYILRLAKYFVMADRTFCLNRDTHVVFYDTLVYQEIFLMAFTPINQDVSVETSTVQRNSPRNDPGQSTHAVPDSTDGLPSESPPKDVEQASSSKTAQEGPCLESGCVRPCLRRFTRCRLHHDQVLKVKPECEVTGCRKPHTRYTTMCNEHQALARVPLTEAEKAARRQIATQRERDIKARKRALGLCVMTYCENAPAPGVERCPEHRVVRPAASTRSSHRNAQAARRRLASEAAAAAAAAGAQHVGPVEFLRRRFEEPAPPTTGPRSIVFECAVPGCDEPHTPRTDLCSRHRRLQDDIRYNRARRVRARQRRGEDGPCAAPPRRRRPLVTTALGACPGGGDESPSGDEMDLDDASSASHSDDEPHVKRPGTNFVQETAGHGLAPADGRIGENPVTNQPPCEQQLAAAIALMLLRNGNSGNPNAPAISSHVRRGLSINDLLN